MNILTSKQSKTLSKYKHTFTVEIVLRKQKHKIIPQSNILNPQSDDLTCKHYYKAKHFSVEIVLMNKNINYTMKPHTNPQSAC